MLIIIKNILSTTFVYNCFHGNIVVKKDCRDNENFRTFKAG